MQKHASLNFLQSRQVDFALNDRGTYVDNRLIDEFLNTLSYPLYFLDFETMQEIIPPFDGAKPYEQIPFQYSLHYIESENSCLSHKEFLGVSGEDPRRAIAESLCENIPENVCVLAYNKKFECGRLKELAEEFPDLSKHLLNIKRNVKDLLDPFQRGAYYNKAMGGSFSIKSVLPAIFPDDPALDYHNLEEIHNGGEAMTLNQASLEFISPDNPVGAVNPASPFAESSSSVNHFMLSWSGFLFSPSSSLLSHATIPMQVIANNTAQIIVKNFFLNIYF